MRTNRNTSQATKETKRNVILVLDTSNPESVQALEEIIESCMQPVLDRVNQLTEAVITRPTEVLSSNDVVKEFGFTKRTLDNYHRRGLPYIKGAPNKYIRQDLLDFFETQKIQH